MEFWCKSQRRSNCAPRAPIELDISGMSGGSAGGLHMRHVSAPAIPIRVIVQTAARPRARYISTTSSAITGAPFKIRVTRSSSSSRSHFATTIVATPFPMRFVKDRI